MKLPEFSVNRPVTTSMFYIGVVMLGFIALTRLPRELFPPITYPQLTIVTTYENAAPEEVETLITKIVEEACGTVPNLKRISSISKEGLSIVTCEFLWGTNMDFASLGAREKIDLVKERLPLGSSDPIVMKFNPFELPVISLSVTGNMAPMELLRLARKFVKEELEKVEGVASANLAGGLEREILVSVDAGRLRASNIAITKVVDGLKSSNLNYPAGTIEEHFYEYLIRTIGEFKVISEIRETVVGKEGLQEEETAIPQEDTKAREKRLVYLKDIGTIKDTFQEQTSISRYNGMENISVSIQKQAGSNTLQVAEKVRKALSKIKEDLPSGMDVEIIYDQAIFIKSSIRGVMGAAMQGGILAFLILFLFLRNIRASLIVAFSMPVSIMVAFNLMYFSGITLNMLSLGGLALGIGMLVDNAIVVIENIYEKFKTAQDIKEASKTGTEEVSGAIFSSTLTTVAVFLPMVFVVGVAGQLFKELAFTVIFSLMASLVVALSLIPRLTSSGSRGALKKETTQTSFTMGLGPLYLKAIVRVLKNKGSFLAIVFVVFLVSLALFPLLDKEFMPKVDQREFVMKVNMLTGTKLSVTDKVVRKIEKALFDTGHVDGVAVNIGSSKKKDYAQGFETMGAHQAQVIVKLKKKKGNISTSDFISTVKTKLAELDMEGAEVEYILEESVFKTALQGSAPIVVEIKGKDLSKIKDLSIDVSNELSEIEGIYGVRSSLTRPSPETKVNVIKDKAALYNLSIASVAQTVHNAIKGVVATKFKEEGREIDIRVRLRKEDRVPLSRVRNILIHSPLDIEVPLMELAYISQGLGPSEIKRMDQERVVLVTANIADRALDKVIVDINAMIDRTEREKLGYNNRLRNIEKDTTIELSGESQQMSESFKSLRFALLLSILLVYMIMAAQFESLWQPFVIMFTVPLSLIGIAIALFVTHTAISVVVILGVIILGGVVVNNGIVLIDSINRMRAEGMELIEAVVESCKTRLRPILMTTLTTVLGLLPLALGIDEGSKLQSPMAITVMGGLSVSTGLTLFVIPALYMVVSSFIERKKKPEKGEGKKVEEKEEVKIVEFPLSKPNVFLPKPEERLMLAKKESEPQKIELSVETRLNKRQKEFLEHLKNVKQLTRKEYVERFGVSVPTSARDLKELLDKGYIGAYGPLGPGRWYELK